MKTKQEKGEELMTSNYIRFCKGYELIHHRVTQSLTEFNQFEIKRIELRDTLCSSVVKTHFFSDMHYVGVN